MQNRFTFETKLLREGEQEIVSVQTGGNKTAPRLRLVMRKGFSEGDAEQLASLLSNNVVEFICEP